MTPRDDVILSYSGLADGEVASSQTCPSCNGGVNKERTLSVGNNDGLLWWRCHRASCWFKGVYLHNALVNFSTGSTSKRAERRFINQRLPDDVALMLADQWSVPAETFHEEGWSYTADYDGRGRRVIMPVRNSHGQRRGTVFRSYWGDLPKAVSDVLPDMGEMISWHRATRYGRSVVVVEDIPSAHRLKCAGKDAVALLGTTINEPRLQEMRDAGYSSVVICLDQDATGQAMTQSLRYPRYRSMLTVKPLEDVDIKDMPQDQFNKFIGELT